MVKPGIKTSINYLLEISKLTLQIQLNLNKEDQKVLKELRKIEPLLRSTKFSPIELKAIEEHLKQNVKTPHLIKIGDLNKNEQ